MIWSSNNRKLKLIILDEADMMTNTAQFALRRSNQFLTKLSKSIIVMSVFAWSQTMCQKSSLLSNLDAPALNLNKLLCKKPRLELRVFAAMRVFSWLLMESKQYLDFVQEIWEGSSTCSKYFDFYPVPFDDANSCGSECKDSLWVHW